ncbi:uncharacterized protein BDZ99DRAFT_103858 [Mytilinidion resinicola]|uniref:Uncharacterized protein n=1 Tax=Mytilinidion resinicola TaxID=574789 RepID=A0A6A6YC52_9PEZI|nr:uncharacterized protein BDZ99DRAFT_103858 [Mytilinidion resinicola]KAF2806093.1 hypothetical protein BDZ99DRAFT_103858 [Mytilinidion resinicola]
MRRSTIIGMLAGLFTLSAALPTTTSSTSAIATPIPTQTLTAEILLGSALRPIPVPGGARLIEPITGGTVNGVINGTISGGFASPILTSNGTIHQVSIYVYGLTSTNQSFFVRETGVGPKTGQVTRLEIEAGGHGPGDEVDLYDTFILARVEPNKAETAVSVQGYAVPQPV